ncbi:hypothetical protein JMJ56_32815 [Belnapia sp. T18]|uniref:Uncharacterized protein n=1 Tax=Belnapia arida TaxID=2804533 RepID=A0ABS1UDH0_9PROT|nr:hypothetical protein [Belnapia arida]MBL6082742.1 hypothetical protein [Belnapia arida]
MSEQQKATTSVRISTMSLATLRLLAAARANEEGGRASLGRAVDELARRFASDPAKDNAA